ncbi:MAG: AAA family ATPase [Armatimonadota bacterium]|nr:AAA family ATPase [Armatimonadota bacterium]
MRAGPLMASPLFIGRDAELAELAAGLEDTLRGRGRLFLVAGEPGIGKTMLAEQLAARAVERGARVLWGRCWEGGGAPAYWPWTQILRPILRDEPLEGTAGDAGHLVGLFPGLAEAPGGGTPDVAAQPAAARFRLFAAVTAALRRAAAAQPLVLVLDDLHAADPASLLLFQFVAADLRGTALLALAVYRDVEARQRDDMAEALGALVREGPSIRLRAFDRAEVRRFMEALMGAAAAADDLSRICEATGGNPLFIREMVRLMAARPAEAMRAQPAIPEGVRAVIHQRLAALDAAAVHVLSVAATVGRDFDTPLVADVAGLAPSGASEVLAGAERLGLVAGVPGTSAFRFSHGLLRETLYDDLPVVVRRELHEKVGTAIERLYGPDLTSHLGELAYHFAEAAAGGPSVRAREYAQRAGDHAMAAYAYEEAAAQYRRALEAGRLTDADEATRCELLLRLGAAQACAGSYQEAKDSFLRAAELARRLDAAEAFARAALGVGEPQVDGVAVDRRLHDLLREALKRLGPGDSALRVRVLARLSLELSFSDDPDLRETLRSALSREALEMARRVRDVGALAVALRARWLAAWGPDELEERVALAAEMLRLARENGDRELELVGRARRLTGLVESGDTRAVDTDIAAHAALAAELRMPYHEWTSLTLRAGRALLDGAFAAAEELTEKAAAVLRGRPIARLAYLNQITVIRWEQRRLGELRDEWQVITDRFPQTGFGPVWLALADTELGRLDDARKNLRARIADLAALPRNGLWLATLAVTSLAAARLDDGEAAVAVYPMLRPYAGRTLVVPMPHPAVCLGSASLYLGLLAAAMVRWDDAVRHLDAALLANTRLAIRPFVARTQYAYARALFGRARTGDRERAVALLDEAESAARVLGMTALGLDCAALREREAPAGPTTAPAGAVAVPATRNVLRREGDYWTLIYEGSVVRVRDTKGLRHLSRLLTAPGREFHAVDLEAADAQAGAPGRRSAARAVAGVLEERPDLGDAGEMLDARAKAEYRSRLQELRVELDEAEAFNDPARVAKVKEEMDFLVAELARAVGLGGRDRRAASHAERARLNVTRAIRAALDNIARGHPALGRHLRATVRTGQYCSYTPDPRVPIAWES